MRPRPGLLALVVLGSGLTACAADPERCDPARNPGLLTAVGCELGGRFRERDARLRAEVEAREAERRAVLDETARQEAEAERLAASRAHLELLLAGAGEDLAVMERQLKGTTEARNRERAALDGLRARAAELRRRADEPAPAEADRGAIEADRAAVEAEIRALTEEVERRRRAIGQMLEGEAAS